MRVVLGLCVLLACSCGGSLFGAAERGQAARVDDLLKDQPKLITAKDRHTLSALHHAARNGHVEVAKVLLQRGADPNVEALGGLVPIYMAAASGHLAVVRELVAAGADVEVRSPWNPLRIASANGHTAIVAFLLDLGASAEGHGVAPIHAAAAAGHVAVLELLVDGGAAVGRVTLDGFESALTIAAHRGHEHVIRWLLGRGADPNHDNREGRTALHVAAEGGHVTIVEMLLKAGVRVDTKTLDGRETPLIAAQRAGHAQIAAMLARAGAKPL